MTPPNKPPPRPASVRLPSIREETAPGAIQDPSLGRPPPAPRRQGSKPTLRATVAPPSDPPVAQAPASDDFPEEEADTAPAAPHALSRPPPSHNPPPDELAERQSYAELERELAKTKAALADAKVVRVEVEAAPERPTRSHPVWKALGAILAGLIVALAGYFGLDVKTQLEPKVDATKAVQLVTAEQLKVVSDKYDSLCQRFNALLAHANCIERQDRDAHLRGTGHDLTSEPRGGTDWAEQRRPSSKPHQPGEPAVYFTTESCPPAPSGPLQ